jgi:tRNA pseudouridine32 synthase/23S rRNA pseudouridine746 synthase
MDFLRVRFPHISAEDWRQRLAQGLVLGDEGQPLQADTPAMDGGWLYYYRALESETAIPFEHQVLYRDAHLLVVDKPHFLPVIPSGKYLQQTLMTSCVFSSGVMSTPALTASMLSSGGSCLLTVPNSILLRAVVSPRHLVW